MATRTATASWKGGLQGGDGSMRLGSGAYEGDYSFQSRFEEGEGTNPEELIGAAQAGCFSMFLAGQLEQAGHPPDSVDTDAQVQLHTGDEGPRISEIALTTRVKAPGIELEEFDRLAQASKENCPVAKALTGVEIALQAQLID